ncbi:MAG: hypothetical protein NVS1B4_07370 [Gemmatimonadaceae bacterium]
MTPTFKPITAAGVATALQKAERYRLINDPWSAESICLDVLAVAPDNAQAVVTLLLAITDQFGDRMGDTVGRARDLLPRLGDAYKRAYYAGIIDERRAKAHLRHGAPGSGAVAYEWFREAMEWFEKAEQLRPPGNDESILRWNACARVLARREHLKPRRDAYEPSLE